MKKTPKSENEASLKDFLKQVKEGLLEEKQVKLVTGGSHSRPLTGFYGD